MEAYTYSLLSKKDYRTYFGSTINLERRLLEHNSGKNISTKGRAPFTIIYSEKYETIAEARQRERYFKSRIGRRELQKIFETLNLGE